MVTTRPPKTIVKPTALGPVANTDTKLLIYGLFQKGRVLAQDGDLPQDVICLRSVAAAVCGRAALLGGKTSVHRLSSTCGQSVQMISRNHARP